MEDKKYLPIGSVVLTTKLSKKIMIIGHKIKTPNEQYDYVACLYPEGLLDSNKYIFFNNKDIKETLDTGNYSPEDEKYMELLEKLNMEL